MKIFLLLLLFGLFGLSTSLPPWSGGTYQELCCSDHPPPIPCCNVKMPWDKIFANESSSESSEEPTYPMPTTTETTTPTPSPSFQQQCCYWNSWPKLWQSVLQSGGNPFRIDFCRGVGQCNVMCCNCEGGCGEPNSVPSFTETSPYTTATTPTTSETEEPTYPAPDPTPPTTEEPSYPYTNEPTSTSTSTQEPTYPFPWSFPSFFWDKPTTPPTTEEPSYPAPNTPTPPPTTSVESPQNKVRQCQELFSMADKDKDGFLSKEEFRWLIKALGIWKGDKEAADNIFEAYDYNGDGRMGNCRSGEFSAFIGQPEMVEKVLKFLKGEMGTKG